MLEAMEKLIRDQKMLSGGVTVLCAVSGGADSICLLHALYHLRHKLGFALAAAHYNHLLREEESDRDAAFVAQFVWLCCGEDRLSDGSTLPAVPLFIGSGDVGAESKRRGTGIEETAREMRYAFLRQAALEVNAQCIATAHTADDNVETILFHFARGSGLRGMTGIQPVQNDLIRPLLTTTRQEVESYLTYYGLPHQEDRTNSDDAYARNRIRHHVVPVLEEICPGFAARAANTASLLRSDDDLLSSQARDISSQALPHGDGLSIPASLLADAPAPLSARAVRELIGRLNGGDQDCSAAHLGAIVRLCRGTNPSAQISLPYGLIARREYQHLILTRAAPPPPLEETVLPLPGQLVAGGWRVTCVEDRYTGQLQGPLEFWLNRDRVCSLTLRSRQTGDRLKLLGRPGKTVKKWFVDEKIPAHFRSCLPVLVSSAQVAAVAGLGPADELLPPIGASAWHIILENVLFL